MPNAKPPKSGTDLIDVGQGVPPGIGMDRPCQVMVKVQEYCARDMALIIKLTTGIYIRQLEPAINGNAASPIEPMRQRLCVDQNSFRGHRHTMFAITDFTYLYTVH